MKKRILPSLLIFSILSIFFISSCSDSTSPEENGTLKLYLTDAPSDYDEVNITFSEISAHINSDWITIVGEPITVNLLDYSNGETFLLGSESLPSGKYTQIRLHISDANIVIDTEDQSMTVPSEEIKLGPQFTMEDGITYEMVIDFDAAKSVVVTGPADNPSYKLKPHIRMVAKALTGSISGKVMNDNINSVAYAKQDGIEITSSTVKEDGTFKLAFLEEGEYDVFVEDAVLQPFSAMDVFVKIGENTDLGEITLLE